MNDRQQTTVSVVVVIKLHSFIQSRRDSHSPPPQQAGHIKPPSRAPPAATTTTAAAAAACAACCCFWRVCAVLPHPRSTAVQPLGVRHRRRRERGWLHIYQQRVERHNTHTLSRKGGRSFVGIGKEDRREVSRFFVCLFVVNISVSIM